MGLAPEYYEKLLSGEKDIKVRLYDEKRRAVKVGDEIDFTLHGTSDFIKAEVIGLRSYSTLLELYSREPRKRCGMGDMPVEKIIEIMRAFYPCEEERRYGAVAIEIKLK